MRSEATLPLWDWTTVTVATSTSLSAGENPGCNHLQGTGKLDHELIDNAVVTGRAGDGPRRFEFGHRNSLEQCGPLKP
jgi:hypothetical protein